MEPWDGAIESRPRSDGDVKNQTKTPKIGRKRQKSDDVVLNRADRKSYPNLINVKIERIVDLTSYSAK